MVSISTEVIFTTTSVFYPDNYQSNPHHRRCIDGKITGCGKCVGYCNYDGHPGYLTKELRKEHDCIKKGCNYYISKCRPPVISSPFSVLAALL